MSILTPVFPTAPYQGNLFSCTVVIVDAYSPANYTPANNNLCGHLSGIDTKLGQLTASVNNISCTTVNINTFTPTYYDPATNVLCAHLQAIDVAFGNMDVFAPQTFAHQLFTDGDNGTFTANITGMNSGGGLTLAQDGTVFHETGGASLKATSTSTSSKTISHDNVISVKGGKQYEFSTYVFVPASGSPTGAVVSMTTSGTGSVRIVNSFTVGASNEGTWQKVSTRYFPDGDQDINVTINITGFTDTTVLNFDNLVVAVNPTVRGNQLSEHYFTTVSDTADAFNRIGDNFVSEGNTIVTSPANFNVTFDKSVYWMDGIVNYFNPAIVVMTANSDNYVFYNSFNDTYVVKPVAIAAPQPPTDVDELILWKITTDFVGVTAQMDMANYSPFGTMFLADRSVTTIKIALGAVTDAEMNTTGVGAGDYIFTNLTVSSQGRITAASSPVVITSVLDKNILQYDSGTGKWINTDNLTLQADASTLVDNSFLNSPDILLTGYFDSDPGAGITPTAIPASIQLMVSSTVPEYRLAFSLASEKMSLNQAGYLGIGTTTPNNFLQVVGLVNFDNATANTSLGYLAGNVSSFSGNVYVGHSAGMVHTAGNSTMVGYRSGEDTTIGSFNSFYGAQAGQMNIEGNNNTFVGYQAGFGNFADSNTFIGFQAGQSNTTGTLNTYLGYNARGSAALSNATAIGNDAEVTSNNSLILGNLSTRVGIGITSPAASAILDLTSTTGALLLSRMTTGERDALTAVDGMVIYNITTNAFNFRENGAWVTGSGLA